MGISATFGLAVEKKLQANTEEQGRQALKLIDSAQPQQNAAQAVARATGVGTRLNVTG